MSLEDLLGEDTITVQSRTLTKGASGGATHTPATKYSAVPARVRSLSLAKQALYAQAGIQAEYEVQTQQAGILANDLIVTSDGRTLQVKGARKVNAMGTLDAYYIVPCVEVKTGG